jgi:hypothetical protein
VIKELSTGTTTDVRVDNYRVASYFPIGGGWLVLDYTNVGSLPETRHDDKGSARTQAMQIAQRVENFRRLRDK